MLRRIVIAALALATGIGTAGALLAYAGGNLRPVYVAGIDLPAGAVITRASLRLAPVQLARAQLDLAFQPGQERNLVGSRASHPVAAGQLLQRPDVVAASGDPAAGLAQVLVPVHDAPPLRAGDRIDLLAVAVAAERTVVTPFATGVLVAGVSDRGLVLSVRAHQAPAFVFAASAMRLAVVVVDPEGPAPELAPVAGPEQALAEAHR